MEFSTALDIATIAQIVENDVFAHIEFGINAGLLRWVWRWTQATKDGSAAAARQRMTMLSGVLMREGLALKILWMVRAAHCRTGMTLTLRGSRARP